MKFVGGRPLSPEELEQLRMVIASIHSIGRSVEIATVRTAITILAVLMPSPAGAQCNFETVAGYAWLRCGSESHNCADRGSHYVCTIERDHKGTPFAKEGTPAEVWIMKRSDGSISPRPTCQPRPLAGYLPLGPRYLRV